MSHFRSVKILPLRECLLFINMEKSKNCLECSPKPTYNGFSQPCSPSIVRTKSRFKSTGGILFATQSDESFQDDQHKFIGNVKKS